VSQARDAPIHPSTPSLVTRTRTAPTAIAPDRYQNTRSLLLSHSQGGNLTRLATTKTTRNGARISRVRVFRASPVRRPTARIGQNRPVFFNQNQTGLSPAESHPAIRRGYWCSIGAVAPPVTAASNRGTASTKRAAKNPIQAGRGKISAQTVVTSPSTSRRWTGNQGRPPHSTQAARNAAPTGA